MLLWGEVAVEKVLDGLPLDEKVSYYCQVAQREKYVGKTKGDRQDLLVEGKEACRHFSKSEGGISE